MFKADDIGLNNLQQGLNTVVRGSYVIELGQDLLFAAYLAVRIVAAIHPRPLGRDLPRYDTLYREDLARQLFPALSVKCEVYSPKAASTDPTTGNGVRMLEDL